MFYRFLNVPFFNVNTALNRIENLDIVKAARCSDFGDWALGTFRFAKQCFARIDVRSAGNNSPFKNGVVTKSL